MGKTIEVLVICRAEEQRRGVDCAARDNNDVCRVCLFLAVALDMHLGYIMTRRAGLKMRDVSAGKQRHILVHKSGINTNYLGIGLCIHQAWEAIACIASDTSALVWIHLIQHDAERCVKRPQSKLA